MPELFDLGQPLQPRKRTVLVPAGPVPDGRLAAARRQREAREAVERLRRVNENEKQRTQTPSAPIPSAPVPQPYPLEEHPELAAAAGRLQPEPPSGWPQLAKTIVPTGIQAGAGMGRALVEPVTRTVPPLGRALFGPEPEFYRPPGAEFEAGRGGMVRPTGPLPPWQKAMEMASVALPATAEGAVAVNVIGPAFAKAGVRQVARVGESVGRELAESYRAAPEAGFARIPGGKAAKPPKLIKVTWIIRGQKVEAETYEEALQKLGHKPPPLQEGAGAAPPVEPPRKPPSPPPPPAQGAEPYEPWQIKRDDYLRDANAGQLEINPDISVGELNEAMNRAAGWHEYSIRNALARGRSVPPDVLKDYPGIKAVPSGAGAAPPVEPPTPPVGLAPPPPERRPIWAMTPEEAQVYAGRGARASDLPPPPPRKPPVPPSGSPPEFPSGRTPGGLYDPRTRGTHSFTPDEDLAILENAVNPPKPTLEEQAVDLGRSLKAKFIDANDPLVVLQRETGIPVHDLAQLAADAGGAGEEIVRQVVLPTLRPISKDLKWLQLYMVARRNEDLLARNPGAKLPGGMRGWPGTLQAQAEIGRRLGPERLARIQTAAEALWDADQRYNLGVLRSEGLLDADGFRNIVSDNPHYIPWNRADFEGMLRDGGRGGPASVSSTGMNRLEIAGSERALDKPLARFVAKFSMTQQKVAENKAARALVQSLVEMQRRTGEELVRFVEPAGEIKRATNISGQPTPILSKAEHSKVWDTVSYFENGRQVTADVPALYAQVAKGLNEEASNMLTTVGRALSAPLRYGVVVYNPVWPMINVIMNTSSAWFREGVVPFGPDWIAGIQAVVKKNELFSEVAGQGLLMRGFTESMKDMTQMQRATRQVSALGGITLNNPKDAALIIPRLAAKPFRGIAALSTGSEQAIRVAAYRKLKREGVEAIERAIRTKEVAVDFSKIGTSMRTINAVSPFTNASLQATLLAGRTIYRKPKWAAIAASPFIAASAMAHINNMRFETSNDIPSYEYTRNWVFQFGEGTRKDGTKFPLYFKIPKGPLASGLTFPAEAIFNFQNKAGNKSTVEFAFDAAIEGAKTVSPVDPGLSAFMPPILETAAGATLGKDPYTGRQIVPRREEGLFPEQQFGPETSRQAIMLGRAARVSPRKIDWAIKNYTGGTGEAVMALVSLGLDAVGYEPEIYGSAKAEQPTRIEQIGQVPGVRRVFGAKGTERERQGWEIFNRVSKVSQQAFNELPDVNRLGIRFGEVGNSINGNELTLRQRSIYQQVAGKAAKREVATLMEHPGYAQLSDEEKEKEIRKAVDMARDAVRGLMMRTFPEIQQQAVAR